MAPTQCSVCQLSLESGYVSVRYQGTARRLKIQLNQVPAMVCPRCKVPHLASAVAQTLKELGLVVQSELGSVGCRQRIESEKAA